MTKMSKNGLMSDITRDLTWVDMLKGIAIIGVFLENWLNYFRDSGVIAVSQSSDYQLVKLFNTAVGPFVQIFIILSGFGLTLSYFRQINRGWSWKAWTWRRITKIVFPYYIFVLLSFLFGMCGTLLYDSVHFTFSPADLIALLTFTRNFYPPSWGVNPPLWYMPVIIGLYILFPFLIFVINKWGPAKTLLLSAFASTASLVIAFFLGTTGTHGSDLFLFWTFQFALGMVLAYLYNYRASYLRKLIGIGPLMIGLFLISISWYVRTYIPYGKIFNDPLTSIGIFLTLLNVGWSMRSIIPASNKYLVSLSKQSYYMYLIHYPVLKFLLGPIFTNAMNPFLVVVLGGLYIGFIYFLCSFISKSINTISHTRILHRQVSPRKVL